MPDTRSDRAEVLKQTSGHWIVASLETQIPWPLKPQNAEYEGREFLLLPAIRAEGATKENPDVDRLPAIALRIDSLRLSDAEARAEIMRFASALAWQDGGKLEILMWTAGSLPRQMGLAINRVGRNYLEVDQLQSPESEDARTALALYREGISLDNPFYAFLSLYKAFSIAVPAKVRGDWMARKRDFRDERARSRWEELERSGPSVGDYLRDQGRHAIAHADRDPFVNPDRTDDHFRLAQDVPLMRALAEAALEEKLGVLKPFTICRQHLYELEGFRALLPEGALAGARRGNCIPLGYRVQWPAEWLLVAVAGPERHPLVHMELVSIVWQLSGVVVRFRSHARTVELAIGLDFTGERLRFDPLRQLIIRGARASRAQIEEEIAALRAQTCILGNGYLEVWDARRKVRLGRSEVCMPVNMLQRDAFDALIEDLEELLKHTP